jgi:hypothetical protein
MGLHPKKREEVISLPPLPTMTAEEVRHKQQAFLQQKYAEELPKYINWINSDIQKKINTEDTQVVVYIVYGDPDALIAHFVEVGYDVRKERAPGKGEYSLVVSWDKLAMLPLFPKASWTARA